MSAAGETIATAPVATAQVAERLAALDPATRGRLRATLRDDMETEYDARFLTAWVRQLPIEFSPEFLELFDHWDREEGEHFTAFRDVCALFLDDLEPALAARRPDFGAIAHLFSGEFEILCLLAYDELATVRGYKGNLELYDRLGPVFGGFVRSVVADEASHYAGFRRLLRARHAHRLSEAPAIIRRIRAADGTPYRATFVLDHDDPVYGAALFDEVAHVLEQQLTR
ncbi:MAG: hypothetical protein VCC00_15375 [Deltaproteobacteria bacterium]